SGAGTFNFNNITFAGFENLNLSSNETITLNNTSLSITGIANDVVTLGTGNDTVTFTGGDDTVTLGTGNHSVTFASGTNTVNATIGSGATLHAGDSLVGGTGGTGSDTLNLSGKGSLDLNSFTFSGFETVNLDAQETVTFNGSNLNING